MEKMAVTLIVLGAVIWAFAVLFMEARWQPQMLGAAITIVGIIVAHVWEEIFREED